MAIGIDAPGFSGHETFPFRYRWLKKGVDSVLEDPSVFTREDALVRLGVGKNMVRSIRHWCLTAGLLEENDAGGRHVLDVTPLGELLFGSAGRDPYLEDMGTLWLLHWQVATNPRRATTWFWVFSNWHQSDLRKEWLVQRISEVVLDQGWKRVALSSISRDVDCFIRTYVPARGSPAALFEDVLDCPLAELELIQELADRRTYRFVRGDKPTLPDEVFLYALQNYWLFTAPNASSLTLEEVEYGLGSPGKVFQLDEESVVERLERIHELTQGVFEYRESAGIRQLFRVTGQGPSLTLLDEYYRRRRGSSS